MVDKKQKQLTSDLQDVHDSMLDGLSALAEYFGLKSVTGRIYGTLLLTDRPLSLDEISDRLGTTKSNISSNIRIFENLRMIHRVYPVGTDYENRRNYYRVETDLQLVATYFSKHKLLELERVVVILGESITKFQSIQDNSGGRTSKTSTQ